MEQSKSPIGIVESSTNSDGSGGMDPGDEPTSKTTASGFSTVRLMENGDNTSRASKQQKNSRVQRKRPPPNKQRLKTEDSYERQDSEFTGENGMEGRKKSIRDDEHDGRGEGETSRGANYTQPWSPYFEREAIAIALVVDHPDPSTFGQFMKALRHVVNDFGAEIVGGRGVSFKNGSTTPGGEGVRNGSSSSVPNGKGDSPISEGVTTKKKNKNDVVEGSNDSDDDNTYTEIDDTSSHSTSFSSSTTSSQQQNTSLTNHLLTILFLVGELPMRQSGGTNQSRTVSSTIKHFSSFLQYISNPSIFSYAPSILLASASFGLVSFAVTGVGGCCLMILSESVDEAVKGSKIFMEEDFHAGNGRAAHGAVDGTSSPPPPPLYTICSSTLLNTLHSYHPSTRSHPTLPLPQNLHYFNISSFISQNSVDNNPGISMPLSFVRR